MSLHIDGIKFNPKVLVSNVKYKVYYTVSSIKFGQKGIGCVIIMSELQKT